MPMSAEQLGEMPVTDHNSCPWTPSSATKKSVPFTLVSLWGSESPLPGTISFTRTVPAIVPSLFHSSLSLDPNRGTCPEAEKKQRPVDVSQVKGG